MYERNQKLWAKQTKTKKDNDNIGEKQEGTYASYQYQEKQTDSLKKEI